jgi:hypothetical protein
MGLNETGSGLCPAARFDIDGVEVLDSAAMVLVH